jgi:hypothetical protein
MLAGLACTVAGIGLLLAAAGCSARSIPTEYRTRANLGVGIGLLLQLAGLYLADGAPGMVGWLLIVISLPALVWGCMNYAEGKGYPKLIGALGIAGMLGLIVLIVLPNQRPPWSDDPPAGQGAL